ncbi:MAG: response regulator [Lachnospiraceae bacterium]|nr:response regulator [Lachnospiraceae bacterium]
MTILAVDNEAMQLEMLKESIAEVVPDEEIQGFSNPHEALVWSRHHKPEIAFLDIQMPVMDGIRLAKALKTNDPQINLIFVTGYYEEYVLDALPLYFSGYLEKPVNSQKVRQALDNLRYPLVRRNPQKRIRVRCFGDFEVYVDGRALDFSLAKAKEIFAFLVDRKGSKVNGNTICATVYEKQRSLAASKSNLRNCVANIKATLHSVNADDVFIKGWDSYAIDTSLIECDYYDWEENKPYAVRAFHGEYMSQYSWAETTLASLLNWK